MFVVMMSIAAVCVLFVDLDFKSPNSELFKDIKALLKNVELDVFFIVVFMSGRILTQVNISINLILIVV